VSQCGDRIYGSASRHDGETGLPRRRLRTRKTILNG
jgi:hypothetical protein